MLIIIMINLLHGLLIIALHHLHIRKYLDLECLLFINRRLTMEIQIISKRFYGCFVAQTSQICHRFSDRHPRC